MSQFHSNHHPAEQGDGHEAEGKELQASRQPTDASWVDLESVQQRFNAFQPLAQRADRGVLAPEQCVDRRAGLRRERLEASALEFVGDEDVALLRRQRVQRGFDLLEGALARELAFRAVGGRGGPVVEHTSSSPSRASGVTPANRFAVRSLRFRRSPSRRLIWFAIWHILDIQAGAQR